MKEVDQEGDVIGIYKNDTKMEGSVKAREEGENPRGIISRQYGIQLAHHCSFTNYVVQFYLGENSVSI